ncbi:hypothetical protein CAOG_03482 [Capsaspora owczarzaki ATCC 30864]|uniref:Zinc finger CHCC-type domain-containing protein n=1 Tax=Capsaspora owczarzaki (strain ATCC 30864) TaxID=595528 RepID=A0A0D2WNA6_CAPO3|nr:hypothetical protein CAOG_03482 [Capsaspora owczarzaki ATCC 30864]KJE92535.1 hypothetical protein CAOG_003482 [Capsaspora owczarzaki ATCC 30864]|eukprot:XP_004348387.1 hypothetical protein CAOG_03482 [Capsaspora owczarzaki ATCC 30864]
MLRLAASSIALRSSVAATRSSAAAAAAAAALAARTLSSSASTAGLGLGAGAVHSSAASVPSGKPGKDMRDARFINREQQTNKQIANDLIAQAKIIEIPSRSVWCDGGGGALGHPKVYINLDPPGPQPCGYCGLRFVKSEQHGHGHGHGHAHEH